MRPVNLIPPEERSDRTRGLRSAPLAYIIVGALLLALGAVTLLVVTDKQISSRKAEVARARRATNLAEAKASRLAAYTTFHSVANGRVETVTNLANSRFDWEKVMRQLALVSPDDVWLSNLTGSVRASASVGGGESVSLRSSVPGPALSLAGCATSQVAVANYVTELKGIDGVTRVGVQSSHGSGAGAKGESGSVSASGGCDGASPVVEFQMVVAFDAAPIPADVGGGEEAIVEAPVAEAPAGEGEAEGETAEAPPEGE